MRPMGGERGYVMIYVLMTAAVLGLISAFIMHARLQASLTTANASRRASQDLAAQTAINQVTATWALNGASCTSGGGVSCSGSGCSCQCTDGSGTTVASSPSGGECQLTVTPP